jgi:hypothetical protein
MREIFFLVPNWAKKCRWLDHKMSVKKSEGTACCAPTITAPMSDSRNPAWVFDSADSTRAGVKGFVRNPTPVASKIAFARAAATGAVAASQAPTGGISSLSISATFTGALPGKAGSGSSIEGRPEGGTSVDKSRFFGLEKRRMHESNTGRGHALTACPRENMARTKSSLPIAVGAP